MSANEGPNTTYTGRRKNRLSLKWKTAPVISTADAAGVHGERLPVDLDAPAPLPANVVSFLENETACVVLFPYAPDITESQWEKIDAARRIRFFLYACSDAPVPPGVSGIGTPEDYPMESVRWAISRSTCIRSVILNARQPRDTSQALVDSLLELDAKAGKNDDERCVVTYVADRPFVGDDEVLTRPQAGR